MLRRLAGIVAGRLLWALFLIVAVSVLVFVIFNVLPGGDIAAQRAGPHASPADVEAVRHGLGLGRPVAVQYLIWMRDLFVHQDLGFSHYSDAEVGALILDRLPVTLMLMAGGAIVWLIGGLIAGVAASGRRGGALDRALGGASLVAISAPVFWLGYMAMLGFAAGSGALIPVLPGVGAYLDAEGWFEHLTALILPCLVLGVSLAAIYFRLTRATVGEQMESGYVAAARARGLPPRTVLWRHAARTGIVPIVGLAGIDMGMILAGNLVIVETVFNVPGLGRLLTDGVSHSDAPVVQGVVIVSCLAVVVTMLVADLLCAFLDPRLALADGSGRESRP